MSDEFHGEIVVASRIVDYLSSGLYESPSACLKELINNAYDADARHVDVFVKPDADRIIIADDGHGMDRADFVRHFSRISESYKRERSDLTPELERPKIGKIGIGFIAANEICNVMEVISTKAGSRELLQVEIRFDLMRQPPEQRARDDQELAKADYYGTVDAAAPDDHYTHIFLKDIKGEAREILAHAGATEYISGSLSLYGLSAASVAELLRDNDIRSWAEFDTYSRNLLEIGLNVPVPYHSAWMPEPLDREVRRFTKRTADLDFEVFLDGGELRKPVLFAGTDNAFVSRFKFSGANVAADGYFYVQHGAIRPQELRGLLLRIRHAAVGEHDPTFLNFSPTRGPLFQSWISAEVWADDRLEEAMNIDRRTLRAAHPAYVELQRAVHEHLAGVLSRARTDIYGAGSAERKRDRANEVRTELLRVIDDEGLSVSPSVSRRLRTELAGVGHDTRGRKTLLQKFRVDELYELVVDVAKDTLSGQDLERFLTALTKRISGSD